MNKALIVIDMQNDFVTGSLANPAAELIVSSIAEMIESFDGDIILTQDTHRTGYLGTQEGKRLPVDHCMIHTDGWSIVPAICRACHNQQSAKYIEKSTFGVSSKTSWGLETYDEVEVVGVCTDICVISNVLIIKALYPELRVKVHSNLCAGTTDERHVAAIEVMRSCQVDII